MKAPLLTYFGEPLATKDIKKNCRSAAYCIQMKGFVGSSFALTSSAIIRESSVPHLFIFRDKEEASYFINDIESLLNNEVFFFPSSYRRAYQIEETDNTNILLRSEVLNKLNNKRNPIIITYSKALSEKVVSRKVLKKQTISLNLSDKYDMEDLEQVLISLNFELVDFVIEPGQYSIRGGILDVFSFANEHPFRIEFFNTEIESIRIFDINTQLSKSKKKKITIVPNTEAKKNIHSQVSLLEYLPKNSVIWAKDIHYTKGVLSDYFNRAQENYQKVSEIGAKKLTPKHLFTNGIDFCKELINYTIVENNNKTYFNTTDCIISRTIPITKKWTADSAIASINRYYNLCDKDRFYKSLSLVFGKE